MLRATFSHLRGVSPAAERRLWQAGVCSWRELELSVKRHFSPRKVGAIVTQLKECAAAWEADDHRYFLATLPPAEQIRVFGRFRDRMTFLDVETTGLSRQDQLTAVSLLSRGDLCQLVRGVDLDELPGVLARAGILVTFNGTRFDLPFILREFGADCLTAPSHLDLYPVFRANGYRGGQKKMEQQLNLARQLPDVDGAVAVELWQRYAAVGDERALARLLIYNAEDVLLLERLAHMLYDRKVRECPLPLPRIQAPNRVGALKMSPGFPLVFGN